MKSLGPLTFNSTSSLSGILTLHNRLQIPSIQNQIQDSLLRHYKVSLKPKNLFTTLHLGLRLWTLRDVYIIKSTGQPSQTQLPKQWTKPVPLRDRTRKRMSEFFMIASETGRVILWPYFLTAKKTYLNSANGANRSETIDNRPCMFGIRVVSLKNRPPELQWIRVETGPRWKISQMNKNYPLASS